MVRLDCAVNCFYLVVLADFADRNAKRQTIPKFATAGVGMPANAQKTATNSLFFCPNPSFTGTSQTLSSKRCTGLLFCFLFLSLSAGVGREATNAQRVRRVRPQDALFYGFCVRACFALLFLSGRPVVGVPGSRC